MRRLRRIFVAVVVLLAVVTLGVEWVAPVALSMSAARDATAGARLAPSNLQDLSVSTVTGTKLSYFGYDFEVPWSDIDDTKTKSYPNQVILTFHSGLRLMVGASPAKLWVNGFASNYKVAQKTLESVFGHDATQSDYAFIKKLYEFTPDKMNLWAIEPAVHYRDVFLLTMKSAALLPSATSGIFNIQNQSYKGFQQGNPQARSTISVALYSNEGSIDFTLVQKDYDNPAGISQAEINCIVQSLRKGSEGQIKTAGLNALRKQ